ncbi:MAG: hypothetical protein EA420_06545 [Candidatus Competibacteraceae bacterium]|nr:MAG: hypothetical protein EA420_06545 [Candidatus Competibacteraceae bacterium]
MDYRCLIPLALLALCVSAQGAPNAQRVTAAGDGRVMIQGQDFGTSCPRCEVIADFGGFKYAFPIERWSPEQIILRVADLGKGERVRFQVVTADGASQPLPYRLPKTLTPARRLSGIVAPNSVPDLLLFEHRSTLAVGDKGENRHDVSQPPPACGAQGWIYDSAELVIGPTTRFGGAEIINRPQAGCARCAPLVVRWYHEPTGRLHYQVHVYRRVIEGVCPERIRR